MICSSVLLKEKTGENAKKEIYIKNLLFLPCVLFCQPLPSPFLQKGERDKRKKLKISAIKDDIDPLSTESSRVLRLYVLDTI